MVNEALRLRSAQISGARRLCTMSQSAGVSMVSELQRFPVAIAESSALIPAKGRVIFSTVAARVPEDGRAAAGKA
jgi:hypothetical protein